MDQQPVLRSLKEGDPFVGFLLAQEAAFKVSARGTEYLELTLIDASGSVKGFLWDIKAIEGDMDLIQADAFLKLKGTATSYNGRAQLKLDKVRFALDEEVGDFSRFFPVSARPVDGMLRELDALVATIADPWLRRLLERLLQEDAELRAAYAKAPAAKSLHHVCLGGLLEHSLSVAAMADLACRHYGDLNRDIVLAAVLLHDLGKTRELSYSRSFGYTDEGNLLGHITMEAQLVQSALQEIPGFPEELRLHLLHALLAHHGKLEFGSPVLPKTPEALLVHYLDDLDGKLESMGRAIRDEGGPSRWTPFVRSLDRSVFRSRWPKAVHPDALT